MSESTAGRGVTLRGAGMVTFSGSTANTYAGWTTVSAGSLALGKTAGLNAVGAGGLKIDNGATTTLLASNQIADAATTTINGTLALGGFSQTLGAVNGIGSITTAAGGVLTVGASNNLSSQFDGVITGGGTIAKAGTGTFALGGTNTFGGSGQTVTLNAGTLRVSSDSNLGHSANSLTFNGGTLALSAALTSSRSMNLSGAGTIDTDINAASFSGAITGSGSFTKSGSGMMTLTGTNSFTGGLTINGGTVAVNSPASLGATSGALTVNAGTLRVASGFSVTRNISLGDAASAIEVDAGQTYSNSGVLSGAGGLTKAGSGTLLLSGANSYTGATTIDAGTLSVLSTAGTALSSSSVVTVNDGGTLLLGGDDQIDNAVPLELNGGTIAKEIIGRVPPARRGSAPLRSWLIRASTSVTVLPAF